MKKRSPDDFEDTLKNLPYLSPTKLSELFQLTRHGLEVDEIDEKKERESHPSGLSLGEFMAEFACLDDKIDRAAFAPITKDDTTGKWSNPLHSCVAYYSSEVKIKVYLRSDDSDSLKVIDATIGAKRPDQPSVVLSPVSTKLASDAVSALAADSTSGGPTEPRVFRLKVSLPPRTYVIAAELHRVSSDWSVENIATAGGEPPCLTERRLVLFSCTKLSDDEYELVSSADASRLKDKELRLVFRIGCEV